MTVIIDTHVHIYPFYEIDRALRCTLKNLEKISPGSKKIACLTEPGDCDVYTLLAENSNPKIAESFSISGSPDDPALRVELKDSGDAMHILPGQQIITSENLEVLSLGCARRVRNGQSARQTIDAVLKIGGLPVLAWGLGKWLGQRGRVVSELIGYFAPVDLVIGDTTMRPYGWGVPTLFKTARERGYTIVQGSDPMPFTGEEIRPGSYASEITGEYDYDPVSLLSALTGLKVRPAGRRGSVFQVASRTIKHKIRL